jgi:hypothetical protein
MSPPETYKIGVWSATPQKGAHVCCCYSRAHAHFQAKQRQRKRRFCAPSTRSQVSRKGLPMIHPEQQSNITPIPLFSAPEQKLTLDLPCQVRGCIFLTCALWNRQDQLFERADWAVYSWPAENKCHYPSPSPSPRVQLYILGKCSHRYKLSGACTVGPSSRL